MTPRRLLAIPRETPSSPPSIEDTRVLLEQAQDAVNEAKRILDRLEARLRRSAR